jgi:hypothetical protein
MNSNLQYLGGFTLFVWPGAPMDVRSAAMPYHRLVGMTLFAFAGVTAAMGITERAAYHVKLVYIWNDCC